MEQEYQEIDLVELAQHILKKWYVILIVCIFFAFLAFTVSKYWIEPVYEAQTTLFIGKEPGGISNISLSDLQVGNKLVTDYQELIQTNLVTEEVVNELDLEVSVTDFKEQIQISTIKDSRFMNIAYQHTDRQMAQTIANKLSEKLTEKAVEIVGVQSIQIVDYAKLPQYPVSPNVKKNTAIGGAAGIVVALGIIFLQMMLKDTIAKEEDIEKVLGLPVLGSIPKFKGEKRRA